MYANSLNYIILRRMCYYNSVIFNVIYYSILVALIDTFVTTKRSLK